MYTPLTSETRVVNFDLPQAVSICGEEVKVPSVFRRKDVHCLINQEGKVVEAAWISRPLAHFLNSRRFSDQVGVQVSELKRCLASVDQHLSGLIKDVIKDRRGPGAMSFCQANENVAEDEILISERSFNKLVEHNRSWEKASHVIAIRFPNLGPKTTQRLKLVVNKYSPSTKIFKDSVGERIPNLSDLLDILEETNENDGILDAFYLHPTTLKDCFEGDGDGDEIYIVIDSKQNPIFREVNLTREPGEITDEDIEGMMKKAKKVQKGPTSEWLPRYIDDTPIGPATYAIRWNAYCMANKYKNEEHPMNAAWVGEGQVAPLGIKVIETVMDIRKDELDERVISGVLHYIETNQKEIRTAQKEGNWFAKTVVTGEVQDVSDFVEAFPSLGTYLSYITRQPLRLEDLLCQSESDGTNSPPKNEKNS